MQYNDASGSHSNYYAMENTRWRVSGKGLSWGAIFAGTLTVVAISVLLNLFGIAAGLGSIDPASEADPFSGIGTGALIWWIASNLVALFCGGWVAGRAGRTASNNGGLIQGFMTWVLYSIISIWLVTSAIGSIISGVGNIIGSTLSAAGNVVEQVASGNNNGNQNSEASKNAGISLDKLKSEIYGLLEDTGKKELDPDNLDSSAQNVVQKAKAELTDAEKESAKTEIDEIFSAAKNEFEGTFEALDKEALANVLSARTNMSKEAAMRQIEQRQAQYENLRQQVKKGFQNLKENTAEAAEKVTDAIAKAAMWLAIALTLGAITAALGGLMGAKKLRHDYADSFKLNQDKDHDIG